MTSVILLKRTIGMSLATFQNVIVYKNSTFEIADVYERTPFEAVDFWCNISLCAEILLKAISKSVRWRCSICRF